MASVNKVILVGNLGKEPEIRYMSSGDAIANMSIATTDVWKDKSGERQERTEWHRVIMFGKQAEIVEKYLSKGSQIYIEGKLQTREWEKDGVKRYTTEIIADRMQMLGGKRDEDKQSASKTQSGQAPQGDFSDVEDDIPF